MRVSDLYRQVSQLGFEDSLENEDRFYYTANRALLQVNAIRPAVAACVVNHKPFPNLVRENTFASAEKVAELTYEATDPKSYYFEADGIGVLYIEYYNEGVGRWSLIGSRDLNSRGGFVAYRGFITVDGEFKRGLFRLRFSGEYVYSIKNVAMYDRLYSNSVSDIPSYEPFTRYDISGLTDDFLALASPPILDDDTHLLLNQGYLVENGRVVLLPFDAKGVYRIQYHRAPAMLVNSGSAGTDETTIDLDPDLCALLPTLVAAYVWVEDEPSKAEYYMALYRELAADVERRHKSMKPVVIRGTNGW